jgi:hypothetical protein
MKQLIILCVLMMPLLGIAQNVKTSTIQWNSQRTFNVSAGEYQEEVTSLTSHSTSSIEWKNSDGTTRKNFQVTETIGNWTNANSDGRIQFEIADGQSKGTVTITRKNQETKVLIVIASETPVLYELSIQSIQ